MSALLLDVDNAGYLGHEDALAAQRARIDFGVMCQSIALGLLKEARDADDAKAILASHLANLRNSISENGYENEDAVIFAHLQNHIYEALDREDRKSEFRQNFSRFILLLPRLFRWLVLAIFIAVLFFVAKAVLLQ